MGKNNQNTYLAGRLTALRKENGYTQSELSSRAGVSLRTIQRIEAGQVQPYRDTLKRLSLVLGEEIEVRKRDVISENRYRTRRIIMHLSPLSGFLIPFAQLCAPVVIWLVYKVEQKELSVDLRDIFLFHTVTTLFLTVGLWMGSIQPFPGYVLAASTALFCTGVTLWNGWRLSEDRPYRYLDFFGIRIPGAR